MTPVQTVLARLRGARRSGESWVALCPAHDDKNPSLSISEGKDGRALLKCHAGCATADVVRAAGLTLERLMPERAGAAPADRPAKGGAFATADDAVRHLSRKLGRPTGRWEYRNGAGELVGLTVRWDTADGKTIRPVARSADGWRVAAMDAPRPLYRLADLAGAAVVVIVEGEKCADAAAGIGFTATTSAGGSQAARRSDWIPLAGKTVWVLPDNDGPGRKYAADVVGILTRLDPPAVVRVVELPGLPDGGDLADWLDARDSTEPQDLRAAVETLAEQVEPAAPLSGDDRPTVHVSPDEHVTNDAAVEALGRDLELFQRAGMLVRLIDQSAEGDQAGCVRRDIGNPIIRPLGIPDLRETLTRCVRFEGGTGGKVYPAHPPDWCVSAVRDRGVWPAVRRLRAVVTHPVLLPGGVVLSRNGYEPGSELLVRLPPGLRVDVPANPTRGDVAAAVGALRDVVADFPFQGSEYLAAWFAGLLTPLAWFAYEGPAPWFVIDANVRASGKGLLADVIAIILTGRRFPVMGYTNDREELRKRITTLAMEGDRLVLLDNLTGPVGCDVLDAALTGDRWQDRVLGGNRRFDGPLDIVWFGTANNLALRADTARRVCHIRLESSQERPEERRGFRYPDLRAHVREHRGQLLNAALTILRGWVAAGRPAHGLPAWGSFEGWSAVVREAVVFARLPDPADTREQLQATADRDAASMAVILDGILNLDPDGRGITAAEIIRRIEDASGASGRLDDLRAAVEELAGGLNARRLGYRLRHFLRRNFGGRFLDTRDSRTGNRYIVRQAADGLGRRPRQDPAECGDGADGGDVQPGIASAGRMEVEAFAAGSVASGPYRDGF